jgi:hypothetical protein
MSCYRSPNRAGLPPCLGRRPRSGIRRHLESTGHAPDTRRKNPVTMRVCGATFRYRSGRSLRDGASAPLNYPPLTAPRKARQ